MRAYGQEILCTRLCVYIVHWITARLRVNKSAISRDGGSLGSETARSWRAHKCRHAECSARAAKTRPGHAQGMCATIPHACGAATPCVPVLSHLIRIDADHEFARCGVREECSRDAGELHLLRLGGGRRAGSSGAGLASLPAGHGRSGTAPSLRAKTYRPLPTYITGPRSIRDLTHTRRPI